MGFVIVGVLLLGLKLADFGPVAHWSWWWILLPFALAAVWWTWADASGLTRRRQMDKMEARKASRRNKSLANLGLDERGRRVSKNKPRG